MKIRTLFLLKWKSFTRSPLFEQTIVLRLLISCYVLALLALLYFLGTFIEQWTTRLFLSETNTLILFLSLVVPLAIFDFILKLFFKNSTFNSTTFRRFPNSNRSIFVYSIMQELFSLWNWTLLCFFFAYLTGSIYPHYGLWTTMAFFVILLAMQILISIWINHIKSNSANITYKYYVSNRILLTNEIANYLLLTIKMISRSPRLRQQIFICAVLLLVWFYLFYTKQEMTLRIFSIKIFFTSLLFGIFPMTLNQFLFSAEAAFFDRLMITHNFKKILSAKYLLCVCFSFLSFLILLFIIPLNWQSFIELTSMFLYIVGVVTLLSFSTILFVDTKIDLFGSYFKMQANAQSVQSFAIAVIFAISIGVVLLISWLFSQQVAIYFMMIIGVISILLHNKWFNYLFRGFYPHRYEKMELFRMQ